MEALGMETISNSAEEYFEDQAAEIFRRTDRMFAGLMAAQWLVGILFAVLISPRTWAGAISRVHVHVYAAVVLGGLISSFPIFMASRRPGSVLTRHAVEIGQMLTSALLIHLSGGRIETHFHVFGSLAFLAFYRDWRVLITATAVVVVDHALRGYYWPQSVYGVALIQPFRFFEHAAWVAFEDVFLIRSILQSVGEMRQAASQRVRLEATNRIIEQKVIERSRQLERAQAALIQAEKMSAVGQLAAGVAHEINNPLGIILGFAQATASRISAADEFFLPVKSIEREALRCKSLVQDLLMFSRRTQATLETFDLNEMAAGALSIIETQARVKSVEVVFEGRSASRLRGDKNQLQQVLVNLCANAIDAMPAGGRLFVRLKDVLVENSRHAVLEVQDTGGGIPKEIQDKIFNPFFTTKEVGQGTGLGLSLVYEIVQRHKGSIRLESSPGQGALFTVALPVEAEAQG